MSDRQDAETAAGLTSDAVFTQYHDAIQRYIRRLVHNPDEAQDLTQETFLRAHRRLSSLQDQAALSAWLYRIATHVSYDRLRQSARLRRHDAPDDADDGDSAEARWADTTAPRVDEAFERSEMSACVQGFIARLSDDYRAVILLHDLEGLTNPEMAAFLGCSVDTVKIRLHRARQQLKAALQKGCEFERDERDVLVCDPKSPS